MNLHEILRPVSREQLKSLSRSELIELMLGEQDLRQQAEAFAKVLEEEKYLLGEKYVRVKNRAFEPSSEKSPQPQPTGKPPRKPKAAKDRTLLPSERYPHAPIIEQDIELVPLPQCRCCGSQMADSGMTETSECLSVIPKSYVIKRQIYHKYHCKSCHGSLETAPSLPRIKPGSSYDDDFIIDVGISKYCDLLPVERYAAMAKRQGFAGLPPHSLIELTHYLADFLRPVYELIKAEILSSDVLYADETPHRMLEGDKRSNWFLWGFSNESAAYFECHDTRSGSVASAILLQAQCRYLVSDVYSGYNKAVSQANEHRYSRGLFPIQNSYCNAHARRKFSELSGNEGQFFIAKFQEIYKIEAQIREVSSAERPTQRQQLAPLFSEMKLEASKLLERVSSKSYEARAANYLLKNFVGLTQFLHDGNLPIDNNHQERLLRSPVIGRKTWYGTHSKKGAETAAILFSVVETCKLIKLNPRTYLRQLVKDIHQKRPPYTPRQATLDSAFAPTQ